MTIRRNTVQGRSSLPSTTLLTAILATGAMYACGSSSSGAKSAGASGSSATDGGASSGGAASAGSPASAGAPAHVPDPCIETGKCPPGVWTNVTPKNATGTDMLGCGNFGALSVQVNARHPETVYTRFDCQGIWKSTDYGLNWTGPLNSGADGAVVNDCAGGVSAPPSSDEPILYQSCIRGMGTGFWASPDGGTSWTRYKVEPAADRQDVYPPAVDPNDAKHLLMAGHEDNVLVESIDGGQHWTNVVLLDKMKAPGGTGALEFINMGTAEATRRTWLYLPQADGGSIGTWRTEDSGKTWTHVETAEKEHSYYQIYQPDTKGVVFMAGLYSGPGGVLRSEDYGKTWTHVGIGQNENIVFGTSQNIYAMDGCCSGMANLEVAPQPGLTGWASVTVPAGMVGAGLGVAQAAVTTDTDASGKQYNIILAATWTGGVWRYIEPPQ